MVGLDAAGKTTILYKLKLGEGMLHCSRLDQILSCALPVQISPLGNGIP